MNLPESLQAIQTESDVEQKFVLPLLTGVAPLGLAIPPGSILTKPNIRNFEIKKGLSKKIYFPDYVVQIGGLPILIVEAKKPAEDMTDAAHEARLYSTEFNALFKRDINPCSYCIVCNGNETQLRSWDSDDVLASFSFDQARPSDSNFASFLRLVSYAELRKISDRYLRQMAPPKYFRPVRLLGGTSIQDEQIPYNEFGRVLSSEFQNLFNPATYDDRLKIVTNAYIKSQRRDRYVDEIDRIIRVSSPPTVTSIPVIEDTLLC